MKIIRYRDQLDQTGWGAELENGTIVEIVGDIFREHSLSNRAVAVARVLAPVQPTAILCIAANYRKHAAEGGWKVPDLPVIFMKLPGAVQDPDGPILLPRRLRSDKVDFEGELAVVIGRTCKNVTKEEALDYVLGYTIANDVSARDWQQEWGGGQFCRGKTFDTFCPLGPALVTPDEIPDPGRLTVRTRVNGQLMQEAPTSDMIFDVPTLIEFLSGSTTLHPGTVILTGTPHGVGMARTPPVFLRDGDTVSVEIEGIGILTNPVSEEEI